MAGKSIQNDRTVRQLDAINHIENVWFGIKW